MSTEKPSESHCPKERPDSLRSRLTPLLMLLPLYVLVLGRGFGSSLAYSGAVSLALGLLLKTSLSTTSSLLARGVGVGLAAIGLFVPETTSLFGFWIAVITSTLKRNEPEASGLTAGIAVLWLQSWIPNQPFPRDFMDVSVYALVVLIVTSLPRQYSTSLRLGLVACCIAGTFLQFASMPAPTRTLGVAWDPRLPTGQQVGETLCKILKTQRVYSDSADLTVSMTSSPPTSAPIGKRAFVIEHGATLNSDFSLTRNGDQEQPHPWFRNQYCGDQYVLFAVAQDKGWMSNLGGVLQVQGQQLLSLRVGTQFLPLVVRKGNTLFFQDSDPILNKIAPYQTHALYEIFLGARTPRLLNILLASLALATSGTLAMGLLLLTGCALAYLCLWPVPGDIRFIGPVTEVHEPSKTAGVLRSLNEAGFHYLPGTTGTSVLVVDAGKSAVASPTEKLIVLMPQATVRVGQHTIAAEEPPQGRTHDIEDARLLNIDGTQAPPRITLQDLTIIGTGSPSKLKWPDLLPSQHSPSPAP